jgi:hypothetical protein
MVKSIERDEGRGIRSGAAGRSIRRPVLLRYVVARQGDNGPRLLHVPLGFDDEALVVFTSREAARDFVLSHALEGEWRVRESSAGELVSLLLGPYASIDWVLIDPFSGGHSAEDASENLIPWERFVDQLLG